MPRVVRQEALVRRLLAQSTYPELLGLDVADETAWFPWFLAAALFAKPISAEVARRTAILFREKGIDTADAIRRCGWEGLVRVLDSGGYVRYDFSTADKFLEIANRLSEDQLRALAGSTAEAIAERLTSIRGVGPKTVQIFLRELRGVWHLDLPFSEEATNAAERLGLAVAQLRLPRGDLARLESVLARTWIEHCKRNRWQTCPAGEFCGCVPSKR